MLRLIEYNKNDNNMIKEKRGSLETFIREQLIGPGGCKGMYAFKNTNHEEELGEVINTTPGSQSTAQQYFSQKRKRGAPMMKGIIPICNLTILQISAMISRMMMMI